MNIGFIGLGNMGAPMATQLINSGYKITGYDVRKVNIAGINIAKSITSLAKNQKVIFTMLPSAEELKKVYSEVLDNASIGTILVDCSTVDVVTTQELSAQAQAVNLHSLDAPVSGGVVGATNGTLTFMVGGSVASYEEVLPLLEKMGKKTVFCGKAGAGQSAKICNNMILGISMIGVCEAFVLADKLDLDRQKMFEVASTSSGSCWSLNTYCPAPGVGPDSPSDHNYEPGFSAELMLKDLNLSQQVAIKVDAPTALGAHAQKIYNELVSTMKPGKDFSAILPYLESLKRK